MSTIVVENGQIEKAAHERSIADLFAIRIVDWDKRPEKNLLGKFPFLSEKSNSTLELQNTMSKNEMRVMVDSTSASM